MKKAILLLIAAGTLTGASAQVVLSGSSYTQDFNNIGSGLPAGWSVRTGAGATAPGTDVSSTKYTATPVKWNLTTGGFRNSASATGFTVAMIPDSAMQASSPNRALSVRQVGSTSTTFPGSDSGAAFVVMLNQTTGLTNFQLTFKLQSLDTASPRTTTWTVDYGTGTAPAAFTPATATGTLTTGNHTLSSNTATVNFGTALNNLAGPVWIRIAALNISTGSGNRTTSAIDDFNLSWTGTAGGSTGITTQNTVGTLPLSVTGTAANGYVQIAFDAADNGKMMAGIYDLAGRLVFHSTIDAAKGNNRVTLTPDALQSGLYIIRLGNGAEQGVTRALIR